MCSELGPSHPDCRHVQGFAFLLSNAACEITLGEMPSMLTDLSKKRAVCEELAERFCTDMAAPDMCGMIKAKLDKTPTVGCHQMSENYETVLAQIQDLMKKSDTDGNDPPTAEQLDE